MRPYLLIFDLDGTLIDSRRDLATAVNLMRRDFGLPPLPVETVTRFVGDGVRMLVARSLEGTGFSTEDGLRIIGPHYRAHLADETTLYDGVAEGLAMLHGAGHALAVATNKPTDAAEMVLEHFGLRVFFARVYGGGGAGPLKPDPAFIEKLMRETGHGCDATWMIGDHRADLEAARRAGVRSVFLTYGYGVKDGEHPTLEFADFASLTRYFLASCAPG